jgi:hypothetical protein
MASIATSGTTRERLPRKNQHGTTHHSDVLPGVETRAVEPPHSRKVVLPRDGSIRKLPKYVRQAVLEATFRELQVAPTLVLSPAAYDAKVSGSCAISIRLSTPCRYRAAGSADVLEYQLLDSLRMSQRARQRDRAAGGSTNCSKSSKHAAWE